MEERKTWKTGLACLAFLYVFLSSAEAGRVCVVEGPRPAAVAQFVAIHGRTPTDKETKDLGAGRVRIEVRQTSTRKSR